MANGEVTATTDLLGKGNLDQPVIGWQSNFNLGRRGVNAELIAAASKLPNPSATGQLSADGKTVSYADPKNNSRGFDLKVLAGNIPTPVWALIAAFVIYYIFLK